jgi:type II secretory pathway pseudopilin PulG
MKDKNMNEVSKFFQLSLSIGILFAVAASSFYIWKKESIAKKNENEKQEKKTALDAFYLKELWHANYQKEQAIARWYDSPNKEQTESTTLTTVNYFLTEIEKIEKYMLEDGYNRDEIDKISTQAYRDASNYSLSREADKKEKVTKKKSKDDSLSAQKTSKFEYRGIVKP